MRSALATLAIAVCSAALLAQVPGRNVNMVSGKTLPTGDPYLQRQNEPSVAASTRNPLHLLAGANDYRTVDIPGLPNSIETGDAWMGVFKSYDGGNTWRSTLIPGFPQDTASTSPLRAYKAGADPVVRAGTNGLFYYAGLVFDRGTPAKSAIFVSRFIDNNNQEAGDPIVFLDSKLVTTNDGTAFLDKPWYAVDRPRANAQVCTINTSQRSPTVDNPNRLVTTVQQFPGGAAYVSFTLIVGEGIELRSQIYLSRSTDCGATWSVPQQISSSADPINQGATLAIDPRDGTLYLAWRRFTADGTDDSIMVTRSMDQGRKWDPPGRARRFPRGKKVGLDAEMHGKKFKKPTSLADLASLDQPTREDLFRTNAYPTMTIDGDGRVYVAWSERGFAPNADPDDGDARVLIASSPNGASWTAPVPVDNTALAGHQVMPSLAFAGGKLMIAYYDFQHDVSGVFRKFVDETSAVIFGNKRHTVDARAAMASPGATPEFGPSVRVSEYLMGNRPNTPPGPIEQLQFNPPNLKLFKLGTVPFFGDYIDLAPSPAFVPTASGGWTHNAAPASSPLFHAVWTDNRDVVPPADGNWANYTPPAAVSGTSSYDGVTPTKVCMPGQEGMRNQNVYTARITGGLVAGSPGNSKPLHPTLPRGFVVFAQNATETTRVYRLTIQNQPVGGRASFLQASLLPSADPATPPPAILTTLDVAVPRRSTIARNVYATSTDPDAQIVVTVKEIGAVGGAEVPGGLQTTVVLNPDISNPDISNPDISNAEVSNPDISNPDISNPDISNPDISNPDISNPDISNQQVANPDISNPDISNPDISNPDISNPDISNPDISNPDISNPDISNQSLTDTTWTVTNDGNIATSLSVKLLLNGVQPAPNQILLQLILHKTYTSPVAVECTLKTHTSNQLLANIIRPVFTDPEDLQNPDVTNANASNATLWLAPGESAKITLRVRDWSLTDGITFNAAELVTPVVVPQALDVALVDGVLVVGESVNPAVPLNAEFLNVPDGGAAGIPLGTVGVRVMDAQGGALPGVPVTLSIRSVPSNAQIGPSRIATTSESGVAGFALGALPAGTYRLLAQADPIGAPPAAAWSDEFVVGAAPRQWTVASGGNGSFYEYVRVGGLSWSAARAAAESRVHQGITGRLVTIGSAAENAFVTGLGTGTELRAWIGMFDPDGPDDISSFSWITGEPVGYTNWLAGEPNNFQTEFWVELFTDGTWNNNTALDPIYPTLGYIVEYAPQVTLSVTTTADAGSGSLRQAITSANANGASRDVISFNIAGAGPHVISLNGPLPSITQPLSINGTTQPGYTGAPLVFVDGADAGETPGLQVEASSTEIRGLGIIGFGSGAGIRLWSGTGSVVSGNYIGLTGAGPASGNQVGIDVHGLGHRIGGASAAERNVISGNNLAIFLQSDSAGVLIVNNYIGTNPAGTAAVPNVTGILADDSGGSTIGGFGPTEGNLISGNGAPEIAGNGIIFSNASGFSILRNLIGTDVTGVNPLPNSGRGISLNGASNNNTIETNTIAFNGQSGIHVNETTGNAIKFNSIFSNGALGIDAGLGSGVTPNDGAAEADGVQNFPVLTLAQALTDSFRVTGTFTSTPSRLFEIRFFDNATCDPLLHGEGERQVAVTDLPTDAAGNAVIDITFPFPVAAGRVLVATARDQSTNNTSEFSRCITVASPEAPAQGTLTVTNANSSGAGSLSQAILDSNASAGIRDTIVFNLGAGPQTINLTSSLPTILDPVTIDGRPSQSCDGSAPAVEISGAILDSSGPGILVTAGNTTIRGLSVTAFLGNGIELQTGGNNRIECSYVGLAPDGVTVKGNAGNGIQVTDSAGNTIGGPDTLSGNVVSGNAAEGLRFDRSNSNVIQNNLVGTSAAGTEDRGNGASGMYLRRSSTNSVFDNVVSGNDGFAGIAVCGSPTFCGGGEEVGTNNASGNNILRNFVGTNQEGTPLGNAGTGISIDSAPSNRIGTFAGQSNHIFFNAIGVRVYGAEATRNVIGSNHIGANTGLGIDLGLDGRTANDPLDPDTGPNQLQNFPIITIAANQPEGTTFIQGTLNSTRSTEFVIQLFASTSCDASGNGEGDRWLATMTGVGTDASGNMIFATNLEPQIAAGESITATATAWDPDSIGLLGTSEFSACKQVEAGLPSAAAVGGSD